MNVEFWLERNLVPDFLIRAGIRKLLAKRLRDECAPTEEEQQERRAAFVRDMDAGPIAVNTDDARRQHYEVPTAFFQQVLGPRLKYSSALWPAGVSNLREAEKEMLALTCERAEIAEGMRILDLGCGWGSLSLYLAERFPKCEVVAVSHSATQGEYIRQTAERIGLNNVTAHTMDVNALELDGGFDRIVSVEMFEHVRNPRRLLGQLADLLHDDGKLFIHIFTHREFAYPFEPEDETDWMARHFFTGGIMPSRDLLFCFQDDLKVERHWVVDGTHYQHTLEAWLTRMDSQREALWPVLVETYGAENARRWWGYWRVFFMACAETFGYRGGREWFVSHYRFAKPAAADTRNPVAEGRFAASSPLSSYQVPADS